MKTLIQKDTCTPVFTAALSTVVKTGSNPSAHQQMTVLRWCGVCVCVCACVCVYLKLYIMEYYSVIKKNEIISFATTWMDLEIIIQSEVRQKQILYEMACI